MLCMAYYSPKFTFATQCNKCMAYLRAKSMEWNVPCQCTANKLDLSNKMHLTPNFSASHSSKCPVNITGSCPCFITNMSTLSILRPLGSVCTYSCRNAKMFSNLIFKQSLSSSKFQNCKKQQKHFWTYINLVCLTLLRVYNVKLKVPISHVWRMRSAQISL